jgi:hypothetical protein
MADEKVAITVPDGREAPGRSVWSNLPPIQWEPRLRIFPQPLTEPQVSLLGGEQTRRGRRDRDAANPGSLGGRGGGGSLEGTCRPR